MGDEGIDVDSGKLVDEGLDSWQLFVIKQRVNRDINLHSEGVSEADEGGDVLDAVACRSTCAKARSTDIDGIGAMADGFETTFEVAGGG